MEEIKSKQTYDIDFETYGLIPENPILVTSNCKSSDQSGPQDIKN